MSSKRLVVSSCIGVKDALTVSLWYQRLFGFRKVHDVELKELDARVIYLQQNDDAILEIVQFPETSDNCVPDPPFSSRAGGISQLCFYINDLDAWEADLVSAGETIISGPIRSDDLGVQSIFLRDPAGILVELCERIEKTSE